MHSLTIFILINGIISSIQQVPKNPSTTTINGVPTTTVPITSTATTIPITTTTTVPITTTTTVPFTTTTTTTGPITSTTATVPITTRGIPTTTTSITSTTSGIEQTSPTKTDRTTTVAPPTTKETRPTTTSEKNDEMTEMNPIRGTTENPKKSDIFGAFNPMENQCRNAFYKKVENSPLPVPIFPLIAIIVMTIMSIVLIVVNIKISSLIKKKLIPEMENAEHKTCEVIDEVMVANIPQGVIRAFKEAMNKGGNKVEGLGSESVMSTVNSAAPDQ